VQASRGANHGHMRFENQDCRQNSKLLLVVIDIIAIIATVITIVAITVGAVDRAMHVNTYIFMNTTANICMHFHPSGDSRHEVTQRQQNGIVGVQALVETMLDLMQI
jgi:hypothetical protein